MLTAPDTTAQYPSPVPHPHSIMRFPRMSVRSSLSSRSSTSSEAGSGSPVTAIPCTYHGWVMLPAQMIREAGAGDNGTITTPDGSTNLPISYNKLVEMAKRVGVAQTVKSKSRKPDRATTVVTENAVRIVSKKHEEGAMPLLHASINTVICTLISKRTGVAVIVAHTWDGQGQRGIGCDVIRLKPKGCTTFKTSIQASIDALNRRTAATRAQQQQSNVAPPPYTPFDPSQPPAGSPPPATRGSMDEPPRQRRRGSNHTEPTAAPTEGADTGYMAVEAFLSSFDEPDDLEFGDDVEFDSDEAPASYMDICGPAIDNGYMSINPQSSEYIDVAPHPASGVEHVIDV